MLSTRILAGLFLDSETKKISSAKIAMLFILVFAALLRFYRLSFQSLGYDELQNMLDSDPKLSWSEFFTTIRIGDGVHPPLFFIFERLFMGVFGYNEWVARCLSALGGIAGVWAIFLLGKELKNRQLGVYAAAILSVNYFSIYFSQETRMYSFLLLFATLSYLFLFRVYTHRRIIDFFGFVFSSAIVIYIHYYGFLVIITELVLILIFLIKDRKNRGKLFRSFFVAELLVALSYLPWLNSLLFTSSVRVVWNSKPRRDFFIQYFQEYF